MGDRRCTFCGKQPPKHDRQCLVYIEQLEAERDALRGLADTAIEQRDVYQQERDYARRERYELRKQIKAATKRIQELENAYEAMKWLYGRLKERVRKLENRVGFASLEIGRCLYCNTGNKPGPHHNKNCPSYQTPQEAGQ